MNKNLERRNAVLAMERIIRSLNDEEFIMRWLSVGVADGDIDETTTAEDDVLDWYVTDGIFADILGTFAEIMADAIEYNGGASGLLYVDGIIS